MLLTCDSNQPFANSFGCCCHLIMISQFLLSLINLGLNLLTSLVVQRCG
ncbi:Uncharacterised protein [Klebsiella pneumoniae]|nr:Uncharacterised protein [Klebsiella pneumoniae]